MKISGDENHTWQDELGLTYYHFNLNNQLVGVENGEVSARYNYNPNGLRRNKVVDGETTEHIWNGSQIVAETNESGTVTDRYTYGLNRIGNIDKDYFYLYDGHGDVLALSNSNCDIIWNYDYDAFGNQNLVGNDGVEPYNPFRYCGGNTQTSRRIIFI